MRKFIIQVIFAVILVTVLVSFSTKVSAQCSGSESASGKTCETDPFTGDAYCADTSVNLICYDVGGYCAGDQYQNTCSAAGSNCSLGGNAQVRCSYDGPPPTPRPTNTEVPPPPPPPPPTSEPGQPTSPPGGCEGACCDPPSPDCETTLLGQCSDGSPQFQRVCDYGSCGTSKGDPYCGSNSKDEYTPVWVRVRSVENGKEIYWKGNQTKDKVVGNTWSVDPIDSDGYFQTYNAYSQGSNKEFDRTSNRIDTSGQMNLWIDDDFGNMEYWSNHFCGIGLAYKEGDGQPGSEFIGGNANQCGIEVDFTGAWCKLDPASCGGQKNCIKDTDGCVEMVSGGSVELSNEYPLAGRHQKLQSLMKRFGQRYDNRWSGTFWTVSSLGGKYSDFTVELHLIPPAGYVCTNGSAARAGSDSDTNRTGSFALERPEGSCQLKFQPRSEGVMALFDIERDPRVPNCNIKNISTYRPRVGETISFTTNYESPQGNIGGQLFRGSADGPLGFQQTLSDFTGPNPAATGYDVPSTWTPNYPATFQIGCRTWNDGIAECRPLELAGGPPQYPCMGPTTKTEVTVIPACPTTFDTVVTPNGTSVTLSWDEVQYANGYSIRADAEPYVTDWKNTAGGDRQVTVGNVTSTTISVLPGKTYQWSVEPLKDASGPVRQTDACAAGTFTTVLSQIPPASGNGLRLGPGDGATANLKKGSGTVSADNSGSQIGQNWNNPIRATAFLETSGIANVGLLGVALTPYARGCTEMAAPPAATSPTPPGIYNRLLIENSPVLNIQGISIFYPMNNVNNLAGRNFQFGRFYVNYNNTWYRTPLAANGQQPTIGTVLHVPSSTNPAFSVKLISRETANPSPFNVAFDITFHKQLSSQLWYSRAYSINPTKTHETIGPCIAPGNVREGTGSESDALFLGG